MARKAAPKKAKPKIASAIAPSEPAPDQPLTAREHLYRIAYQMARMHGFTVEDAPDREIWALVDEQFILPQARALSRHHRKANEMLCQALENDERFKEAVEVAKGGVF